MLIFCLQVDEAPPPAPTKAAAPAAAGDATMTDADAELQMALQLSMQEVVEPTAGGSGVDANQAIAGLPGVDPNDPAVKAALDSLQKGEKKDEEKK
jgi:26S proteasome regulatory subunit N10